MTKRRASTAKAGWTPAWLFAALAFLGSSMAYTTANAADSAATAVLRAKYGVLQEQLQHNQFQRPLYMESGETSESVKGDVYALIKHPFATTAASLSKSAQWCDIMMLHINTKFCRASSNSGSDHLQVNIGKKYDQAVEDAYKVKFSYRVVSNAPDYLKVMLTADAGPLSTRDYQVVLEAIPLANNQTFIHLIYSYGFGTAGRLAMQTYLGTIGSSKMGFTVVSKQSQGEPNYIGGMRGLVERNTMRYYLAIEAFLGALSTPPPAQLERRLYDWFAFSEQYPRQLRELKQNEYLDMKRREFARMKEHV